MASKREPSPSMRMRKIALVICEGETEERYINLLKKDQKSAISTDALIKELKKSATVWRSYSKTNFTDTQEAFLKSNIDTATARAKNLKELQNPSSGVYKLIELLKK